MFVKARNVLYPSAAQAIVTMDVTMGRKSRICAESDVDPEQCRIHGNGDESNCY